MTKALCISAGYDKKTRVCLHEQIAKGANWSGSRQGLLDGWALRAGLDTGLLAVGLVLTKAPERSRQISETKRFLQRRRSPFHIPQHSAPNKNRLSV